MPTIEVNGVRLHWEACGAGEPVVLLNGVMMTAKSWTFQTTALCGSYRCLLHDFRGQLLSDKPDEPWRMEDHAGDLRGLLDQLEIESCHLIGTSYGGEVGLIFAAEWPDRVRSLSVISSVSEVSPELDRAILRWREGALEAPETLYRVALPSNFSPGFIAANRQAIEQGEERLRAYPPDFFPAFARLIDAFRKLDVTSQLDRIRCPTLVMVGGQDVLKPPGYSRLIADLIADSELLVIPDAGHAVIIERPDEVNSALLGFLDRHP